MVDSSLLEQLTTQAAADGVQQLVVGGIVQHDDKVLLLQRPQDDFMGGIFELPSGKVESGETLDAALAREVKEETGLDVRSSATTSAASTTPRAAAKPAVSSTSR